MDLLQGGCHEVAYTSRKEVGVVASTRRLDMWRDKVRPAGLGVRPSVHLLRMDSPDALWRLVQKVVCPTDVVWAGRPKLRLVGLDIEAFRPSIVPTRSSMAGDHSWMGRYLVL